MQKQLGGRSLGTQAVYFWQPLVLEKCQKAQIPCLLIFHVRELMILSFCLKWTELTRNCELCSNCESPETWNKLEQITTFCEFGPLQVKWWHHMLSCNEIKKYMEPELSGILWVQLAAKNSAWVSGDPFCVYMRVILLQLMSLKKSLEQIFVAFQQ